MREIVTRVTVYTFEELSEKAQAAAVRAVSEKLNGPWWDQHDTDRLAEAIMYGLAGALKAPGWDTFGEGDFPGIEGLTLDKWDLDRGQSITVRGSLTRENAPALPWVNGIEFVMLNHADYARGTWVEWVAHDPDGGARPTVQQIKAMREAVDTAIRAAWQAGRAEADYMESDEFAREWIEGNEREFTEDGALYE